MALDSALARSAVIGFGIQALRVLPPPTGSGADTAPERAHVLSLYAMGADAPGGGEEEADARYTGMVLNVGRLMNR